MKYTIPMLSAALLLGACGGNSTNDSEKETVSVENAEMNESEEVDFILPQPISLANAFKSAGLTYDASKLNPTTNEEMYAKKIDQLINLGVYSTDLAFCAINNKSQEAREYLTVVQKLGTKVGLKSVFSDKALIEKFDKNLGNPGELEDLIYDIQDRSDAYMEDNDLKYLAAIQFAGAWTEGMYLGIDDSRKKGDLGTALVDQMSLLKNIIKGLNSHPAKNDVRLNEIIKQFETVLSTYDGLASVKAVSTNINVETPKLTADEFNKLALTITALRSNLVNPTK